MWPFKKKTDAGPLEALVLTDEVAMQTRLARDVDPAFMAKLAETCQAIDNVSACYVLDARRAGSEQQILFIAVRVDNDPEGLHEAAPRLWEAVRAFPKVAANAAIGSAANFEELYEGHETYVRRST